MDKLALHRATHPKLCVEPREPEKLTVNYIGKYLSEASNGRPTCKAGTACIAYNFCPHPNSEVSGRGLILSAFYLPSEEFAFETFHATAVNKTIQKWADCAIFANCIWHRKSLLVKKCLTLFPMGKEFLQVKSHFITLLESMASIVKMRSIPSEQATVTRLAILYEHSIAPIICPSNAISIQESWGMPKIRGIFSDMRATAWSVVD